MSTFRLVRIFDEDIKDHQEALNGCTWHYQNNILLRRTAVKGRGAGTVGWLFIGTKLVAVGTHAGKDIVMFGECKSGRWEPYNSTRYKAQLKAQWEDVIYTVPVRERPRTLPRRMSNLALTEAEYAAWRHAAKSLMKADQSPLP